MKDMESTLARETGGIVYRGHESTWSILSFYDELIDPGKRKKRALPSGDLTVRVSIFTHFLRVSTLTRKLSSGRARITKPDGTSDTANITSNVMIYNENHPLPGTYVFYIGSIVDEHLIRQDTTLDLSLFYFNSNFTYSSLKPLPGCEFLIISKGV